MKILVIKTSSLGDIIQSFFVLAYLHRQFPDVIIDWAVEESLSSVVSSHPLIRKALCLPIQEYKKNIFSLNSWKKLHKSIQALRQENYDVVFDLQGNCKSAVVTLLTRGKVKVGLGFHSVREWPNIIGTQRRFEVPKNMNIRLQHLYLMRRFFQDPSTDEDFPGACFRIDAKQKKIVETYLRQESLAQAHLKVMVCPGSSWANKQLSVETLSVFLGLIKERYGALFFLVWGSEQEQQYCESLQKKLIGGSLLIDKIDLPTWQYFMNQVDLVIAMDSSALHLCGTTMTPSFSVFGPTSSAVFKPIGRLHDSFVGKCPYGRVFQKTCPVLRTCPTGACVRGILPHDLFRSFVRWKENILNNN